MLPSKRFAGTYNVLLCFSEGWPQRLDFDAFDQKLPALIQEVMAAWKAELNPTERWPYTSRTRGSKLKACICCAKPPHVNTRERMQTDMGIELTAATRTDSGTSPSSPAHSSASTFSRSRSDFERERRLLRIEALEREVTELGQLLSAKG